MFSRYFMTILAAAIMLPTFFGCGPSRPETTPITGKITFQGKPVPEGTIVFYPPKGRSATGRIQPDGTYELTTFEKGDGAILGNHTVTIEAIRFAKIAQPKSLEEEIAMSKNRRRNIPKPQRLIPQKYADRTASGLTVEVDSGSKIINFDLPN